MIIIVVVLVRLKDLSMHIGINKIYSVWIFWLHGMVRIMKYSEEIIYYV